MGESGRRSQAPVCCVRLLSETRPKIGTEKPPSERGAPGLAPAHSSRLFSLTGYNAAPLLLLQIPQVSCAPSSCPRTFAQAIPHTGKIFPCPLQSWLLSGCNTKVPFAERAFLSLNPKYTLSLILITSCFYFFFFFFCMASITNHEIFNRYTFLFYLCLSPLQYRKLHEGRDFVFFSPASLSKSFAFRRYSIDIW